MPAPSDPGLLAFMALTMSMGYTKTQAATAWTALSGETNLTAASALWDQVAAALASVDNAGLDPAGTVCAQCGQKVGLTGGRFKHHLGNKGGGPARNNPCLGVGLTPAQVRT